MFTAFDYFEPKLERVYLKIKTEQPCAKLVANKITLNQH